MRTGLRLALRTYGKIKNLLVSKAVILMYHRVVGVELDPWSLCVSPNHFAEQMQVVARLGRPARLGELVAGLKSGSLPDRTVVVTFDDGYADNFYTAYPVLKQYGISATVFVVSLAVGREYEFWWDELERLLLLPPRLPETLSLNINGERFEWKVGQHALQPDRKKLRYGSGVPTPNGSDSRLDFYYSVWQKLLPLPEVERRTILEEIARWSGGLDGPRPSHRIMNAEELIQLHRGGLVEIGGHTATHVSLPSLSPAAQKEEILRGKVLLEDILDTPVRHFAYPHGEYTMETVSLVQEAGFESACTIIQRSLDRGADPHLLPRFDVRDWPGDEFERRLSEWFKTGMEV